MFPLGSRGVLAILLALWLSPTPAQADDDKPPAPPSPPPAPGRPARHALELGLVGGGGFAHSIWGGRADRQFLLVGGRIGYVLTDPIGPGFLRNNVELAFEALPAFIMLQEQTAYGVSGTLVFRHLFLAGSRIMPVVSWGAGVLYTSAETPPGTTRINFTPQIGFGVSFLRSDRMVVSAEYRLHHISNANLAQPNPGINSSVLQFGLTWFRRPAPPTDVSESRPIP
jgi:hypothetical protein